MMSLVCRQGREAPLSRRLIDGSSVAGSLNWTPLPVGLESCRLRGLKEISSSSSSERTLGSFLKLSTIPSRYSPSSAEQRLPRLDSQSTGLVENDGSADND